jgi:hypothetical protein
VSDDVVGSSGSGDNGSGVGDPPSDRCDPSGVRGNGVGDGATRGGGDDGSENVSTAGPAAEAAAVHGSVDSVRVIAWIGM